MDRSQITPEIRDRACQEKLGGETYTNLSRKYGVSERAVKRWMSNFRQRPTRTTQQPVRQASFEPHLPDPDPIAGGPSLPNPVFQDFKPYTDCRTGMWLTLGDVHLPFHDKKTVELAVEMARKNNAVGVLLNGDILDCHQVSSHDKDRDALDYVDEIDIGKQFMQWLRSRLPRAQIIYKYGNHEMRTERYISQRAPAISGLEGVNIESWLHLRDFGIEWVQDKRPVMLGSLPVLHGHEYAGSGGVNPARWLFLRTFTTAMTGHFHRQSSHMTRGLNQRPVGVWSHGCACFLYPKYCPLNEWSNGYAFVDVARDNSSFHVELQRVVDGRVM